MVQTALVDRWSLLSQNESELFGRTIRVNIAKPMRIKEGSSRPGDAWTLLHNKAFALARTQILASVFLTVLSISVWSDDDWLKKFSGKTLEEAEAEAEAGETTKTTAQEVNQVSLHALALYLLFAVMYSSCLLYVFM